MATLATRNSFSRMRSLSARLNAGLPSTLQTITRLLLAGTSRLCDTSFDCMQMLNRGRSSARIDYGQRIAVHQASYGQHPAVRRGIFEIRLLGVSSEEPSTILMVLARAIADATSASITSSRPSGVLSLSDRQLRKSGVVGSGGTMSGWFSNLRNDLSASTHES
jgi:hypothetical protein